MSAQSLPPAAEQGKQNSPYAGRWVARIKGKIVAHGNTAEEARRAAQRSRHKEKPTITYMPAQKLVISPLLDQILDALPAEQPLYLIGGAVRDALLGKTSHDLDFGLPCSDDPHADPMRVARRIADQIGAAYYPLDSERGAARLVLIHDDGTRDTLDFAAFRGETLEEDLRGRDFTLNAIALDVHTQQLHDPLGGANDLRQKTLRACAETSLSDDPIRILRAIRLAASKGFQILLETRQLMKAAVAGLPETSVERRRDEIFRILDGSQPQTALRALDMLGVLDEILPELVEMKNVEQSPPHVDDVWRHTLNVLRHLGTILTALAPQYNQGSADEFYNGLLVMRLGRYREQFGEHFAQDLTTDRSLYSLLFFAALYHDVAKPRNQSVDDDGRIRFFGHETDGAVVAANRMRALHLSNDEIDRVQRVIRNHMRIHAMVSRLFTDGTQPTRRAIYRFFRDAREAGVDLVILSLADLRATYEHSLPEDLWKTALDVSRILLENYWERPAEVVKPPSLLDGHELMQAFDLAPSPRVGQLLEAIREAQAMGEISTKDEALAYGRAWIDAQQ
jgi:poly(A) polymerase